MGTRGLFYGTVQYCTYRPSDVERRRGTRYYLLYSLSGAELEVARYNNERVHPHNVLLLGLFRLTGGHTLIGPLGTCSSS